MLDLMDYLSGGGHRIKLKRHEYIRVGIIMVFILVMIVLFALELKYFSNTFQVKSMVTRALFFGACFGGGLGYFLTKDKPEMESLLKFQIWVALVVTSIVSMPMLASLTNRHLSFSNAKEVPVEFVKIDGFYADRYGLIDGQAAAPPDGYHVFIIKDGQLERIKSQIKAFQGAEKGETVLLPIHAGFWGYQWVGY